jgi:hypothetical protein
MRGAILVTSTLPGVRPLGVRGEPLHNAQAQLRAVVRRRLGDRHFHLLAEPEPHALGGRIDWYCAAAGTVRPLTGLAEPGRAAARSDIDTLLADIDRVGQSLEAGPTEDGRLAGRSLRLAARRPSDEHLFLVGDQPVVVCWGYEVEAAGAVLPGTFVPGVRMPASAQPPPTPQPPAPLPLAPMPVAATGTAAAVVASPFPWLFWLLAALLAIAILILASWLLRQYLPVDPDTRVTVLPTPPTTVPPPPPVHDPLPDLRRGIDAAQSEEARLRTTLAALRDELAARLAQCRPVEPTPPPALPVDRWKERDLSILDGCWILGRDTPATMTQDNGPPLRGVQRAGRLCFDRGGRGTYDAVAEFPGRPRLECKAPVTATFQPDETVRIQKPQVTCTDGGSRWNADTLNCRRVDDNVALCRDSRGGELEFRREPR